MAITDPSQVPSSSYPFIGDCIGMESCVDFKPSDSDGGVDSPFGLRHRPCERRRREAARPERCQKIPPPIPCLAQTANQPSHMPWVMRRYYSGDGRLVIREEKVRHHEYFTAHRSNGRLTLRIVLLKPDRSPSTSSPTDHRLSADQSNSGDDHERCGGSPSSSAEEASSTSDTGGSDVAGGGSGAGTCWDYKNVASTSCLFLMPVLPLRPVHG